MGKNKYPIRHNSGRELFIKRFGVPLEDYECFKHATENLAKSTCRTYLSHLPHFFLFLDQDPDSVIKQRKLDLVSADATESERFERLTVTYVNKLKDRGLSGRAINSNLGRIQGFFSNNGRRLSLDLPRLKLSKARKTRKYSPSNDDVRLLIGKADCARDKLIVALMYQNGPAPVDASLLCCGDYPVEPWVYFERSRSKTGEVWRGISTPDVCEYLKTYLNVRGNYKASDPLFVGREGPLDSEALSQIVHLLIVKADLAKISGFKPTSLRDAFEDALVDAEIYHKVKEALMAHNSSIEHEYGGHNKMVTRLVEAMKKVYPLLCLNDMNKVEGSLVGLTKEDIEIFKEIKKELPLIRELRDLLKAKELVHVNDPERLKGEDS